ncbi:SRPBCC domain-containing protein [Rhodocytophaga rosea]|uniref:SRPBCC domain-containing protein n=1 Tax=Rhodocytophaga rosea TaxID=2704465 RepID=A0A6C0GKA6_9BACT|nr:SRPBCC domain-containing protein [Rhodocytophaga rosea]QHT68254.1 SRPBCC domain-containing protein [Rhodocytophaga rosea]
MKTVRTEITIHAPAEKIWNILMDFEQYPYWNPFIKKISGEKKQHGKLEAFIQPEGQSGMRFRPTIQKYEPNREFQWLGNLWFSGIFDGRHSFKLIPLENGSTLFIHAEQFTGLLVTPLWRMLYAPTLKGFESMNVALKQRAETL